MDHDCRVGGFCRALAMERACVREEQGKEDAMNEGVSFFKYCRIIKAQNISNHTLMYGAFHYLASSSDIKSSSAFNIQSYLA